MTKEGRQRGQVDSRVYMDYFRAAKSPGLLISSLLAALSVRILSEGMSFWLAAWAEDQLDVGEDRAFMYPTLYAVGAVLLFLTAFSSALLTGRNVSYIYHDTVCVSCVSV